MSNFVSKQLLAEQLANMLNGGIINRDSKITIRQAMQVVGEMRNKLIRNEIFTRYANFGSFDVPHTILSDFTVTSYKENGKWYINLPKEVLSVYNDLGIYHVSVVGDEWNDFIPLKTNFKSMYRDLLASELEGRKGYIPTGLKLELYGLDSEQEIYLKLIVDSHDIASRDDFKFIPELQDDLLAMSVERLKIQAGIPQDTVLDNVNKVQ